MMLFWYLLIVLGTAAEGEVVLLAAGYAVFQGKLDLYPVMVAAFSGACLGDSFWFELGRRRGDRIMARWPALRSRGEPLVRLLKKFALFAILILRFQIGMRSLGHLAFGMSDLPRKRFWMVTLIAAAIWAVLISYICYLFMGLMAVVVRQLWVA